MTSKMRTSRQSTTREKEARRKEWTPSSSLDAPPAPNGYSHRWIRLATSGFDDTSNVSRKLRDGWEFVRADTLLSEIGEIFLYFFEIKYEISLNFPLLCVPIKIFFISN